jgi:thiol:disulfide interchange protein DsbD
MVHVKSLLGIVLVVVALYFIGTAYPALNHLVRPTTTFLIVAAVLVVAGVLLGAIHRSFEEPGAMIKARKALGVVLVSAGAFALVVGASKPTRSLAWESIPLAEAQAKAKTQQRPLLVDFTASWCGACKELEKHTFSEPDVAAEAGRFVAVRVDATDNDDPVVSETMEKHEVRGLPTVLVYDSNGQEAVRCTDFVPPQPFLEVIKRVN